ncbi:enoyl-CoA hydratase/isomerase family protein [Alteribacillus iranensis]|uniref:Enoyl-CoA hydratase n=1 Tax=Alteribacillus iranensis TaxID=930128 RepID=A0A1I2BNX1_9BACI|nr:enoyl-CoA hydratase-related protein [Alteribacillus iranensis]SFE57866.1 enoyl-CoA hydratase [Alteribacillus iranensis]
MNQQLSFEHMKLEVKEQVGIITIDRADKRNSMDVDSWVELEKAIQDMNNNDDVRAIIITGAGDKSFAAGADIRWIRDRVPLDIYGSAVQDVLLAVYRSYKPVVAAVNGFALGGGCELMTACDIRIASEEAKVGQPEINLGILPAGGGTQQLTKLVGLAKAKELILTGKVITAQEALNIGLLNEVVPKEDVLEKAMETAVLLASKPPVAVKLAKIALNESATADLNSGMALEKALQAVLFGTKDKKEGVDAFLDKKTPNFVGE